MLERVRQRYAFVIIGYVVMSEHFYLLVSEPNEKTLSDVMRALKLGFARRVIGRRRRNSLQGELFERVPERVWQHRFYDFNVCTEKKRIEKLLYLHRNSVKRGLVVSPELWKWSSFRSYALREPGVVQINRWDVLQLKRTEAVKFEDPLDPSILEAAREKAKIRGRERRVPTSRKTREVGHPPSSGAYPFVVAQATSPTLCIAPNSGAKPERCAPGLCDGGDLSVRLDDRLRMEWPKDRSVAVTDLDGTIQHRVVLYLAGKAQPSFKFRFPDFILTISLCS